MFVMTPTKIDVGFNKLRRVKDLDDIAAVLFPGNRRHQYAFAVIFLQIKWSNDVGADLRQRTLAQGVTRRVFERTRAKMRRLGLIDHVSRFNRQHGYREGWVLSERFGRSMERLSACVSFAMAKTGPKQLEKDRFAADLLRAVVSNEDDDLSRGGESRVSGQDESQHDSQPVRRHSRGTRPGPRRED